MEVRNRLNGLDLIDRVPEELWTEVPNIVQEMVVKTIPKEKSAVDIRLEDVFPFQSQRKAMPENVQATTKLH